MLRLLLTIFLFYNYRRRLRLLHKQQEGNYITTNCSLSSHALYILLYNITLHNLHTFSLNYYW